MSRKWRICFLIGLLVCILSVVLWAIDPRNAFELDGNTKVDTGGLSDVDWNLLNGDCSVPSGGSGSADGTETRTCIGSENPPKIFTGGGSKDPLDISSWLWKPADTVPDKDTINHAYAATIRNTSTGGDKVLYIGGDRFAVNGDANIGAWFFQQSVGTSDISSNGGFKFSGVHVDGDVFLVSAFVNGGGTAKLAAYIWNAPGGVIPNGCTKSEIKKGDVPQPGQCVDANIEFLGFADTYAITNTSVLAAADVSWSYDAKFGGSLTDPIPAGGFFEGGADLTSLFRSSGAGDVPCFSSVLLETRSSQETTAVLKDFVLGSLPECKIEVVKDCNCTSVSATSPIYTYAFSGTVRNSGGGTVHNVLVTYDAGTPNDTSDDRHYNCGDLAPKGSPGDSKAWPSTACVERDGKSSSFTSASKPATNIVTASATTSTDPNASRIFADPYTKQCTTTAPACNPNPLIDVTKVCSTDLVPQNNLIAIRVTYSGTVQNAGTAEALINVKVSEDDNNDALVDISNLTLAGCT